MQDRSSRPHSMPSKSPLPVVKQTVTAWWRRRPGPVQIASELGLVPPTVQVALVRCRLNRPSHTDRVTGEPILRYEHDHPGSLIHMNVTKSSNIPDGGGHQFLARARGARNRHATPDMTRTNDHQPHPGVRHLHTVIDDHSRIAHVEMHADERLETTIGVLHCATTRAP